MTVISRPPDFSWTISPTLKVIVSAPAAGSRFLAPTCVVPPRGHNINEAPSIRGNTSPNSRPPNMRSRIAELILVTIAIFFALCLSELTSRWLEPRAATVSSDEHTFYRFDPVLGWSNQANVSGTFQTSEFSTAIRTNRHAMRYHDVSQKHDQPTFRVAVLGDSALPGASEYPTRTALQTKLKNCSAAALRC